MIESSSTSCFFGDQFLFPAVDPFFKKIDRNLGRVEQKMALQLRPEPIKTIWGKKFLRITGAIRKAWPFYAFAAQ
jgi:hypothetical protein